MEASSKSRIVGSERHASSQLRASALPRRTAPHKQRISGAQIHGRKKSASPAQGDDRSERVASAHSPPGRPGTGMKPSHFWAFPDQHRREYRGG